MIPEYGELEIGSLAKVLNVDVPSAISEWNTLKNIIYFKIVVFPIPDGPCIAYILGC